MIEQPAQLASGCIRFVEEAMGIALDYTQDTLPILDHYLTSHVETDREEVMRLIVPVAGAYFGEVLLRAFPEARWGGLSRLESAPNRVRLEFGRTFLHFNPLGMALEAIEQKEAPGWNSHLALLDRDRKAVDDAISALGGVREKDFFRLGVRFEVIETAYETLRARAKSGELFSPDVYDTATQLVDADVE